MQLYVCWEWKTHSVPWRLSPATPPPASAEPADSEFFFRLELQTFLRLVAPVSGLGSSSSSSLLVSFNQAGTALVDLSLKTRPELCGLDAAPLTSVNEAETPDLGRPAPRSLSPLRGVTVVLVVGVCSAALSSAGSSPLLTSPVRSPAGSITVRTLQPNSYLKFRFKSCRFTRNLRKNGLHLVKRRFDCKRPLSNSGTFSVIALGSSQIKCIYLLIRNLKLFLIIYSAINRYHFKEADTIFAFLKL